MSTTTASTVGPRSVFSQDTFTIKAMKDDVNVLLRVSYSMEFGEIREKIREKFQMQGGTLLSENFAVAFVPPATSGGSKSASTIDPGRLRFIQSDYDWVELIEGWTTGKLTLRIFDRN